MGGQVILLYVAGPITPNPTNGKSLQENLQQLSDISLELWKAGHAVINPGANTSFMGHPFNAGLEPEVFYKGDLEMIERCDAVVFTVDWETSTGASAEMVFCEDEGIPTYIYPEVPVTISHCALCKQAGCYGGCFSD